MRAQRTLCHGFFRQVREARRILLSVCSSHPRLDAGSRASPPALPQQVCVQHTHTEPL